MKAEPIEGAITPAVHLEFIQTQAGLASGSSLEEVESYHRALFLNHHARDLERYRQETKIHEDRLAHLEGRLNDAQARLASLDKLTPVTLNGQPDIKPTAPWNLCDGAMFGASLIGIITLLVFGILNISFNLLESGLVTFLENPMRAYFWAALLPVGALGVKVGWDFLENSKARDVYLWSCLTLGIAGVLGWLAAYALVYPTLSKSTSEQIQSLSVFDQPSSADNSAAFTAGGAKRIDAVIVASQAVAEIFLSAALGIYMTMIYNRHRPVRLAINPLFSQLDDERGLLDESVARERLALAEAKGNQQRLENQLSALVSFAKSMFQKESALRQDQSQQKRVLLDQISEQLRDQLRVMENGGLVSGHQNGPRAALGRENGQ